MTEINVLNDRIVKPIISFFFPKYFSQKGVIAFGAALAFCSILFVQKLLSLQWIFFDFLEVFGFFFFANQLTKLWKDFSIRIFEKRLFWVSLGIRITWVFLSYFYFIWMTGDGFEFETADAKGYYGESGWIAGLWKDGKFDIYLKYIGVNYADMGYPLYLAILRSFFGDGLIIPRLIKALLGAYTSVIIYKIGRNNFGESAGRIAGILGMLLPNLIYYCGLHVKETEMVFLVVYFIYFADKVLRSKYFHLKDFSLLCIIGASIFLFRTVLAVCLIASVLISVFFISKRIASLGKRLSLFSLIALTSILILSTSLGDVINGYFKASDQNLTSQMQNYTLREDGGGAGNKLAKYGSRSIFLPFMVIGPLPTLVNTEQTNTMMLGGAFFTRNVYVFFVFIAFVTLYKRKLLRNHVLLLSTLFSYLFVLASSGFALSERFHLPIIPLLLVFAGYGITQLNVKNKKYYIPYLIFISIVIIGWNWFKLAGRA